MGWCGYKVAVKSRNLCVWTDVASKLSFNVFTVAPVAQRYLVTL